MKSLSKLKMPTAIDPCGSYDKLTKEFSPLEVSAPIFERDEKIYCSAESENSFLFCDYYGEAHQGLPWISEKLEKWAKNNFGEDAYWEWENAGLISLAM